VDLARKAVQHAEKQSLFSQSAPLNDNLLELYYFSGITRFWIDTMVLNSPWTL
jgi:hypothetical protein